MYFRHNYDIESWVALIYDNADNRKAAIEAVIKGGMAYLQVRIHPIC